MLGGTGWLGRTVAREAVESGADVVCLARGESGFVPAGAHLIRADRLNPDAYDALTGEWDDVVEFAYDADLVEPALDALGERARHWTLISSVSVYARNDEPGADESAELLDPADPTDYGQAKVAAELASAAILGDRLLIVRPGLIAGPGDPSDRLGYWPARFAAGGDVLVPHAGGRFVQAIEADDLAAFVLEAGRRPITGRINAVGDAHPFATFLACVEAVSGFTGESVVADDAWLLDHGVDYWAGPRALPLWLPESDAAFAQRSHSAFTAAGGQIRPLQDTVRRILVDETARGLHRERRTGLTRGDEQELLRLLG